MEGGKKVGVVSLGCDKNRVDTEKMLAYLPSDWQISDNLTDADLIIINTCAFLESSRVEAIDEIMGALAIKKQRPSVKVMVTGCLPQLFAKELFDELPEVDAFLGVSDYDSTFKTIERVMSGERVCNVNAPKGECGIKRVRTTGQYAYLKIADGCSNHCTYCLIPSIRGKYRSVPILDLVAEAQGLGEVKELILVAQDVARYGVDLSPKLSIVDLLKSLTKLENIKAIRLLYCYPEMITEELIEELATNPKIIKYIDVPMQHADDKILKLMNRKGTYQSYLQLVNELKKRVNGIAIRSTFITGFPHEGEEEFNRLVEFLRKAKLFNAGFFAYSKEEGTAAARLDGQLPEKVKRARQRKLYTVQKSIVKAQLGKMVGKTVKVLAEGFSNDALTYYGRAYFNAPDVDGKIYFFSTDDVVYGDYYEIKITACDGYDLYGERL